MNETGKVGQQRRKSRIRGVFLIDEEVEVVRINLNTFKRPPAGKAYKTHP